MALRAPHSSVLFSPKLIFHISKDFLLSERKSEKSSERNDYKAEKLKFLMNNFSKMLF